MAHGEATSLPVAGAADQVPELPAPSHQAAQVLGKRPASTIEGASGRREVALLRAPCLRRPPNEPAVDGVCWNSHGDDRFPEKPYLSVLEFSLIDPTTALFDSAFQTRWSAVVDFITTIPGLASIGWGRTLENPAVFRCWIQWRSGKAWSSFQKGLGYDLIIPFCLDGSDPLNWTLQTDIKDLAAPNKVIWEFSFTFQGLLSPHAREAFEKLWVLKCLSDKEYSPVYHAWVEPRVSNCFHHDECIPPSKRETIFVGLFLQDDANHLHSEPGTFAASVMGEFKSNFIPEVSWRTVQLCSRSNREAIVTPVESIVPDSFAVLLQLQPTRTYTGPYDQDKAHLDSLDQLHSKTGQRLCPAPNGNMGRCAGSIKEIRKYGIEVPMSRSYVLSVLWLQFKPGLTSTQDHGDILAPVREISLAVEGTDASASLGVGNLTGSVVGLVANWDYNKYKQAYTGRFSDLMQSYASSHGDDLATPPELQTFAMHNPMFLQGNSRSTINCHGLKFSSREIEFVTFYIHPSPVYRTLLKTALESYLQTLVTLSSGQYPRPFQYFQWGVDLNELGGFNSPDCWSYTIAFEWHSPEARITWYREVADGVPIYQRFGYRIDAFKLCFAKPAVSRLFCRQL